MARFGSLVIMISPTFFSLLFVLLLLPPLLLSIAAASVVVIADARLRIQMFMTPLGDGAK